jgi:hypothetical protein
LHRRGDVNAASRGVNFPRKTTTLVAGLLITVGAGLWIAGRWASSAVTREIRSRCGDRVQIGNVHVRLLPSIRISAKDIAAPDHYVSIRHATAETDWFSVLARHVRNVRLEGLRLDIPPRGDGGFNGGKRPPRSQMVIDRLIADGTKLRIFPKQPGKQPLEFDLYRLTVNEAGPNQAISFETIVKNAKPPGEIHSKGKFGPWNFEPLAATPLSGAYTFRNADLGVFKGISGKLSSNGNYHGVLDRIEVDGSTDTPDFALRISGHAVDLACQFHAIVDGTSGNTYLDPVEAHFGGSTVVARGEVVRAEGGRLIRLNASVTDGRLEDMLRLAIKGSQVMTGAIGFQSKIVIPPGAEDVAERLQLDGSFTVNEARFPKFNVQRKVNELSHSGSGKPQDGGAGDVASNFRGRFRLNHGVIAFNGLSFDVPGVRVALSGTYGLLDGKIDLSGKATLQAKLSQTTTGWKSALLKIVQPFFTKKNAGTVLPIHIGGTATSPDFRLTK